MKVRNPFKLQRLIFINFLRRMAALLEGACCYKAKSAIRYPICINYQNSLQLHLHVFVCLSLLPVCFCDLTRVFLSLNNALYLDPNYLIIMVPRSNFLFSGKCQDCSQSFVNAIAMTLYKNCYMYYIF